LGEIGGVAYVSRIDLFADFVADVDMESWTRAAWVTRAGSVTAYAVKEGFSGWAIGLGGPMAARLYDKTLELRRSKKEWLKPLWSRRGWDGESKVLRLEFEIKRDALKTVKLDTLDSVLPRLSDLWRYATTEWLRLTVESEADSTRSRWPTHPLWDRLCHIDWLGDPAPLSRTFKADRAPSIAWILRQMLALLFSFMAIRELDEFWRGMDQLLPELDVLIEQRSESTMTEPTKYVRTQVALKARRFNTHFNLDDIPDEDRLRDEHDELLKHADEYRRKSRGH
jgi:hypothetical protein